jgi:hypothetical protein
MFVGPITPDLETIAQLADKIPKGSAVLELGGHGDYSISLSRRTDKLIVAQPDARLMRCIMVNSEIQQRPIKACNAWITERQIIMSYGILVESEGNHHPSDELNLVQLENLTGELGFEFEYIVAHRVDFLEQFTKDYPDVIKKCVVFKTYIH